MGEKRFWRYGLPWPEGGCDGECNMCSEQETCRDYDGICKISCSECECEGICNDEQENKES